MTYNWVIIKQDGMTIGGQAESVEEAKGKMKRKVQDGFYLTHPHLARYFVGSDVELKEFTHVDIHA